MPEPGSRTRPVTGCTIDILKYYDPALVAGKKVGDRVTIDGKNFRIEYIMQIDGHTHYIFDNDPSDFDDIYAVADTDYGLVGLGLDNYTQRTIVYQGPVRFSKNATIVTGWSSLITSPQIYFFQPGEYPDRYAGYSAGNICVVGNFTIDDRGYVNWIKEIFRP